MANIRANINKNEEEKAFYFKLKLSLFIVFIWVFIEWVSTFFNLNLETWGLQPKKWEGLIGVFTMPFLHGDWNHVLSNATTGVVLFTALFIFHEKRSLVLILIMYLFSGLLLHLIGEKGSTHIGASALLYALAFFLFISSLRSGNKNAMAISFFIILFYGSMIWGVLPYFVEQNVSWEGHMAGAVTGSVLALYETRNYRPSQSSLVRDERPFFEKHPLE